MVLIEENNRVFGEIKYQETIYNNYKAHFHNHLYIGTIKSGTLKIEFAKKTKTITANQIIIFNPYEIHKTINIDAKEYYTLCLKQEWLTKYISKNFYLNCNILESKSLHNIIIDKRNITSNLEALKIELKSLLKYQIDQDSSIKNVAKITKEYILENINKKLTLSTISKDIAYDRSYIIREFKKAYSITPKQFIIILKTNLSKDKIKEANISHLATDYGFFDQSHFNKNFKKIFAISAKNFK